MKVGDLVWFDSFYHQPKPNVTHPSQYSISAVIVKRYSESEKKVMFGEENYLKWKDQKLYDVMMRGKIYPAPERTLIGMFREEELI